MNKSNLLSFLDRNNFVVDKSEFFINDQEEYIYCSNKIFQVNFIIKEYFEFDQKAIMEDVQKVRTTLRSNNINIWNSYFIIFFDASFQASDVTKPIYNIERNSKGLRKYVILQERDLYRIPFIKNIEEETTMLNFSSDFDQILHTTDHEVTELIQWIFEEEGDSVEIKQAKLKGKIEEIFVMENEGI